ncbi:MAG: transketolase [Oligoflexia bacterium]|nr:transketolase [Oligoflexia bacterium]
MTDKFLLLKEKAAFIRKEVLRVAVQNGAGHIAPSLSTVDLLVALYYDVIRISKDWSGSAEWERRDRVIFSKAHGCYALYAILCDLGFIGRADWENFYKGSFLSGCLERREVCGLEVSCGSLGHGLPMAVGIAYAAKRQGGPDHKYRIYCIIGDGEMQEGSNWEALQFAAKYQLSNLKIIIDHNRLQAMDFLENVLSSGGRDGQECTKELVRRVRAFGCYTKVVPGHDVRKIVQALRGVNRLASPRSPGPQCLIAKTIKGYGLPCMENVPKFHFRLPTPEEMAMGARL